MASQNGGASSSGVLIRWPLMAAGCVAAGRTAGSGHSGSGPGGRVVLVIPVGVLMVRVPSGVRWRVQPRAWCFNRWWVRQ